MQLLDLVQIEGLGDKFSCNGVCLLQNYGKQPTKNGGSYIGGMLSTKDGTIAFKAWSNSRAYSALSSEDITGKVILVSAEVNIYNGVKGLFLNDVNVVTDEACVSAGIKTQDLIYSKYNSDAYWNSFVNLVKSKVSENAFKVFELLMQGKEEKFKYEFAAISHHDNCKSGLLAHSLKVCQAASLVKIYPNIYDKIGSDLLYLACAVHDIGKVDEYNMGSISEMGKQLSHLTIGCLEIQKYEGEIKHLMGEKFYVDLLSVVAGHHGEYGEPPRTVAAYIIHKLDLIDSMFTSINELLELSEDGRIAYDGFKLS